MIRHTEAFDFKGHDQICPLCDRQMNNLAGDPGWWAVGTFTSFAPGVLKFYCQNCVGTLVENALIQKGLDKYDKIT
jgi:hypothetical protein